MGQQPGSVRLILLAILGIVTAITTVTDCTVASGNNLWNVDDPTGVTYNCDIASTGSPQSLTIVANSAITITGNVGGPLGPIVNFEIKSGTSSPLAIQLNGAVNTTGDQKYGGPVSFQGSSSTPDVVAGAVVTFTGPITKTTGTGLSIQGLTVDVQDTLNSNVPVVLSSGSAGSIRIGSSAVSLSSGTPITFNGQVQLTRDGDQTFRADSINGGWIGKDSSLSGHLFFEHAQTTSGMRPVVPGLNAGTIDHRSPGNLTSHVPIALTGDFVVGGAITSYDGVTLNGAAMQKIQSLASTVSLSPDAFTDSSITSLTKTTAQGATVIGSTIQLQDLQSASIVNFQGPASFRYATISDMLQLSSTANVFGNITCQGLLGSTITLGGSGTQIIDVGAQTLSITGDITKTGGALQLNAGSTLITGGVSADGQVRMRGTASVGGDIISANAGVYLDSVIMTGATQAVKADMGQVVVGQISKASGSLVVEARDKLTTGLINVVGTATLNTPSIFASADIIASTGLTVAGSVSLVGVSDTPLAQTLSGGTGGLKLPMAVTKSTPGDLTIIGNPALLSTDVIVQQGGLSVQGSVAANGQLSATGVLQLPAGVVQKNINGDTVDITGMLTLNGTSTQTITGNSISAVTFNKALGNLVLQSQGSTLITGSITVNSGSLTVNGQGLCEVRGGGLQATTIIATDLSFNSDEDQIITANVIDLQNLNKQKYGTLVLLAQKSITVAGQVNAIQGSLRFDSIDPNQSPPALTFSGGGVLVTEGSIDIEYSVQLTAKIAQTVSAGVELMVMGNVTKKNGDLTLSAPHVHLSGGEYGAVTSSTGALTVSGQLKSDHSSLIAQDMAQFSSIELFGYNDQRIAGSSINVMSFITRNSMMNESSPTGRVVLDGASGVVQVNGDIRTPGVLLIRGQANLGGQVTGSDITFNGDVTLGGMTEQHVVASQYNVLFTGAVSKNTGEFFVQGSLVTFAANVLVSAIRVVGNVYFTGPLFQTSVGSISVTSSVTVSTGTAISRIDATQGNILIGGNVTKKGTGMLSLGGETGITIEGSLASDGAITIEDMFTTLGNLSVSGPLAFFKSAFFTAKNMQTVTSTGLLSVDGNVTKIGGSMYFGAGKSFRAQFGAWVILWGGSLTFDGSISVGGNIYGQEGITLDTCVLNAPGPQIVDALDGCLVIITSIDKSASDLYLGGRQCIKLTKTSAAAGALYFYDERSGAQPICPAQCRDGIKTATRGALPPQPSEPTAAPSMAPTPSPTMTPTLSPSAPTAHIPPTAPTAPTVNTRAPSAPPSAPPTSPGPTAPPTAEADKEKPSGGIGAGGVAGIIVAILLVAGAGVGYYCIRKKKRSQITDHVLLSEDVGGYRPPEGGGIN